MRKLISGREVEFNINFALLGGSHLALGLVGGSETQFQYRMWIKFTCEASKWVKNCHPRWSLWRYLGRSLIFSGENVWPSRQIERNIEEDGDIAASLIYYSVCKWAGASVPFIPSSLHTQWLFFILWQQHWIESAAWWITTDYRPDSFIWSVSWVILSSLTLSLTPVRARRMTRGLKAAEKGTRHTSLEPRDIVFPLLGMCKRMKLQKVCECTRTS